MAVELRLVRCGEIEVPVRIRRTRRTKTVGIAVSPEQEVTVSVPRRLSLGRLDEILARRAEWIGRQLERLRALPRPARRQFADGEALPYLGGELRLEVSESRGSRPDAFRFDVRLRAVIPAGLDETARAAAVRHAVAAFYRREAAGHLRARTDHFARRLGVKPPAIHIRDQKRRWGSCDPRGRLFLNWRLILMPPELLDYVVAHEVCHLLRADHSPAFWAHVRGLLPDVAALRRRLRREAEMFVL